MRETCVRVDITVYYPGTHENTPQVDTQHVRIHIKPHTNHAVLKAYVKCRLLKKQSPLINVRIR